jgi:glycosyltransferase involved in cell wall biosynthesis
MQIGFSLLDLAMGGAQTFWVQLAQVLATRGHQISYFLFADRNDNAYAVPSLLSALDKFASPVLHPRKLLEAEIIQIDGYHSFWRKLSYLLVLDRCVETFHSTYSIQRSAPIYAKHRVVTSQAIKNNFPLSAQVIYPGISMPAVSIESPKEYDVAILGRIHSVKGHLLFLRVCEALFQQRGHLQALMIGGHAKPGPYQKQVDSDVERLRRLGVRIDVIGDIPSNEVFSWLVRSRVLLVTSESEGFGRMAVEALACRVPVVSNPVGGLLEIVLDGETGFLAERDNPASFAELANHLLVDRTLCQKFGQQGRLHVEKHFSLQAVADQYEALYRRVRNAQE